MLIQVALIVFALFGLVGLVVDSGYARLTQAQMQSAADGAAVEGMRLRNLRSDPFESDCKRRSAARNVVAWTFDDDFVPGADAFGFGAGPQLTLTGGVGDLNALQTIEPGNPPVYKPMMERNQSLNLIHGDMVSGRFHPDAPGLEANDYTRADFDLGVPVPPGTSGLETCPPDDDFSGALPSGGSAITDDAFLVRLRRTNDPDGLDQDADVSSRGEPLPLLFARASAIGGDASAAYSVRRDGLTIRATAIASVRPALRVGALHPELPELGAVSFALDRACWEALAEGVPNDATVDSSGVIQFVSACSGIAGRFVAPARSVGVPIVAQIPLPGEVSQAGFVAIYETVGSNSRVVGFGRSALCGVDTSDPELPCTSPATIPGTVRISRRTVRVAAQNASAHLPEGLPMELTPAERDAILLANRTLEGSLLAPVLAR
jgi:hypothetical protein